MRRSPWTIHFTPRQATTGQPVVVVVEPAGGAGRCGANFGRSFWIVVTSMMLTAVAVEPDTVAVTRTVLPFLIEPIPSRAEFTSVSAVTVYVLLKPSSLLTVIADVE